MIISLIEEVELNDREINALKQLEKEGRSRLKRFSKKVKDSLEEKELVHSFYYSFGRIQDEHRWILTIKGRKILEKINNV